MCRLQISRDARRHANGHAVLREMWIADDRRKGHCPMTQDIRPNDIVLVPMTVAKVEDDVVFLAESTVSLSVVKSVQHRFIEGDNVQANTGAIGKVLIFHDRWVLVERTDRYDPQPSVFGIDDLTRLQVKEPA